MKFCIKEPLPSKSCFVSSPCCSVLLPPPQLSPGKIINWVLGRLYHFIYLPYDILWWNIFSPNSINLSFRIMLVTNDWRTSGKNDSKITFNSLIGPSSEFWVIWGGGNTSSHFWQPRRRESPPNVPCPLWSTQSDQEDIPQKSAQQFEFTQKMYAKYPNPKNDRITSECSSSSLITPKSFTESCLLPRRPLLPKRLIASAKNTIS